MYKVIFISDDLAVGQETFSSLYVAAEYEEGLLSQGFTTALVVL